MNVISDRRVRIDEHKLGAAIDGTHFASDHLLVIKAHSNVEVSSCITSNQFNLIKIAQ